MINQYARKGTGVLVSGRLEQRSFDGKDGVRRSRTEIVVEDFNFTGSGNRDGNSSSSYASPSSSDIPAEAVPDDIPEGEIDLSEVPF